MAHGETQIGVVRALYRFPVKSTAGEALRTAAVTATGLEQDRRWAVYTGDGGIASGKRTSRFRPLPGLMHWSSKAGSAGGPPWLICPDGRHYRVDDPAASGALSAAFGQELDLRPETTILHHDETPMHLVTTSSLAAVAELAGGVVDERRFRANLVIDTFSDRPFSEDDWSGAELVLGAGVVLALGPGMPRCVMIDQAQAGIQAHPKALKLLGTHHRTEFGLQAGVAQTGTLRVGDAVTLRRSRSG